MKIHFVQTIIIITILAVLQLPFLSSASTTEDNPTAVEVPNVNIKLVGTAVAYQPEKSLAVVEIDGHNQIYLREGDVVDNVLIKQILRDRVIVDIGHGQESVKLQQSLSAGTKKRSELTQPPNPPQSFGPRPPEGRNLKVVYLDRKLKKSLIGQIDRVLREVRINPIRVYGKTTGIQISPIVHGSVFSKMGLKSNEVIKEVNGKSVTGPDDAVALFQRMNEGGEFNIKVKGRRTRQIHMIVE